MDRTTSTSPTSPLPLAPEGGSAGDNNLPHSEQDTTGDQGAEIAALAAEAIAFAIEYADNCKIPDGYADENGYPDVDWLSDWGAFLADQVVFELKVRGLKIVGATTSAERSPVAREQSNGRSLSAITKAQGQ